MIKKMEKCDNCKLKKTIRKSWEQSNDLTWWRDLSKYN